MPRLALPLAVVLTGCASTFPTDETDTGPGYDGPCELVCADGQCGLELELGEASVTGVAWTGAEGLDGRWVFRAPGCEGPGCEVEVPVVGGVPTTLHARPGQAWDVDLVLEEDGGGARLTLAVGRDWTVEEGPLASPEILRVPMVPIAWGQPLGLQSIRGRVDGGTVVAGQQVTELLAPAGPATLEVPAVGLVREVDLQPDHTVDLGLRAVSVPLDLTVEGPPVESLSLWIRASGSEAAGTPAWIEAVSESPVVELPPGRWEVAFDPDYTESKIVHIGPEPEPVSLSVQTATWSVETGPRVDGSDRAVWLDIGSPTARLYGVEARPSDGSVDVVLPVGTWTVNVNDLEQRWMPVRLGRFPVTPHGEPIVLDLPPLLLQEVTVSAAYVLDGGFTDLEWSWTLSRSETQVAFQERPDASQARLDVVPGEFDVVVQGWSTLFEVELDLGTLFLPEQAPEAQARARGVPVRISGVGDRSGLPYRAVYGSPDLVLHQRGFTQLATSAMPLGTLGAAYVVDVPGFDTVGIIRPDTCLQVPPR